MTPRKNQESALGRGLDALIRPEMGDEEKEIPSKTPKVNNKNSKKSIKPEKQVKNQKKSVSRSSRTETRNKSSGSQKKIQITETDTKSSINNELVEDVILEVHKNPRISLWSAKSAAVLRLLKKTKPEFSISKEASALIEEAVKDKYPDIWEVFEDRKL
jgi:hypothetical protein